MSQAMFSTLDNLSEGRTRLTISMMSGLVVQVATITVAVLLGMLFPQELRVSARHYVMLLMPTLTRPAPVVRPVPRVARVLLPKLDPPPTPDAPVYVAPNPNIPKAEPKAPLLVLAAPPPPSPTPVFAQVDPSPKVQKMETVVLTGGFDSASNQVTTKRPADQVQTGGFGSPQGFRGQAKGDSAGNVPKLGAFGLPDGPGYGNGTGGAHGVRGVVASAGFANGVANRGYGQAQSGSGVAVGGFQKVAQIAQFPLKSLPAHAPVDFQPVEVISKPSPTYTDEARRLGIQGEVTLSVVFQAGGGIRVLEVLKSLGHGLDQAAEQAASQIRFKPAHQDGKPVDFPATLRIEFRLADQAT